MKATDIKRGARGMTLIEVLVIIVIVVVLVGWLLPALANARKKSLRISCHGNLKQVSLGLRMWAGEHGDKFPMQVSPNDGGSLEWVGGTLGYRHFMAASNEIYSPRVLVCPGDGERKPTMSFSNLMNENISYIINLSADVTNHHPKLLTGDRHLTRNGIQYATGSYLIPTQQVLSWGLKPHERGGNIALTDGSVQQFSDRSLQSAILNAKSPTNWLAFP